VVCCDVPPNVPLREENYSAILHWRRSRPAIRKGLEIAYIITDYLFEEFTSIPLITMFHEVAVNPKIVGGWIWPGQGAGRTTHFDLIKAAQ
jgi:hypothetical protein